MLRTTALAAVLLGGISGFPRVSSAQQQAPAQTKPCDGAGDTLGELWLPGARMICNGRDNYNDSRTPVTGEQTQELMNPQPAGFA